MTDINKPFIRDDSKTSAGAHHGPCGKFVNIGKRIFGISDISIYREEHELEILQDAYEELNNCFCLACPDCMKGLTAIRKNDAQNEEVLSFLTEYKS